MSQVCQAKTIEDVLFEHIMWGVVEYSQNMHKYLRNTAQID